MSYRDKLVEVPEKAQVFQMIIGLGFLVFGASAEWGVAGGLISLGLWCVIDIWLDNIMGGP